MAKLAAWSIDSQHGEGGSLQWAPQRVGRSHFIFVRLQAVQQPLVLLILYILYIDVNHNSTLARRCHQMSES